MGGEAEAHAPFKQYEYRANSSLVLTTDSHPRDTHERTGEPEPLWGRIDKKNFGDRAVLAKPPELEERLTKSRKKKARDSACAYTCGADGDVDLPLGRRSATAREASVLSLADDVVYKPQTKETRAAYEAMLSVIQQQFGGQPMDVLGGAADEVLTILKNDKIKKPDKKKEIDKLLNPITTQMFEQFLSIHDASDRASAPSGDGVDTTMDDDIGVAVEFEDDDDDDESDFDQVQDELDEDDDDVAELNRPGGMQMGGQLDDEDMHNSNEGLNVNVQDIYAYWIQTKISQAFADIDPQQSQKLAEEILKIIAEGDDRDVENRLVMELDYEKFDLIKLVLRNRVKKVCGNSLARAKDQEEKKKIEQQMMGNPSLVPILEQLHATRASAKERQKSIRDEAKRLLNNDSAGTDGPRERRAVDRDMESELLMGHRQLIDLDNLSFHQGGLLMANKKGELPDDDIGVAVEFEEDDDDDEESDFDQVQDELDEDDDDVAELNRPGGMQMGGQLDDEDMQNVNVQDIDAYWLQRKITQAYADIDPQQSQKLADEILKIIAEGDERDVENRLVMELDYEKFDLIKLVLRNRFKIVWCTRLARAEDQEERKKIEEEMMGNPSLVPILEKLHATTASTKEMQKNLEKSIRDEAKRLLNSDSAGTDGPRERRAVDRDMESELLIGQRQLLDLDNLSFHQGGLLMATKVPRKCWSILFLFLLLVLSFSTMGVTADSDGAWCDAHELSVQLSINCEVTEEVQSRDCCDAIFATLGRNGCLCKVVQEPEFRTSGMAGGSIIVQMYHNCDGGPHVSEDAEEECDKVESSPPPPPPPLPPPPPSPARERPRLPGHTFWIRAGLVFGAFVVFSLVICGCWRLYKWIGNRWFARGRGHRLGGQLPWWSAWCNRIKDAALDMVNRIKQVLQERRNPAPATPLPLFASQVRPPRVFTSFHEMVRATSRE